MDSSKMLEYFERTGVLNTLGIKIVSADREKVVLTMEVDARHHQPMGIMHGGVSVVLAETAASIGATVSVDLTKQMPVGIEINANHLRSAKSGILTTVATPVYHGRTLSVWNVEIRDERDKLICVSRCTLSLKTGAAFPGNQV